MALIVPTGGLRRFPLVHFLVLALAASSQHCSSKSNPEPPPIVVETGVYDSGAVEVSPVDGSSPRGTEDVVDLGVPNGDTNQASEVSSPWSDAVTPDAIAVDTSWIDAATCRTSSGCWSCPPIEDEHFRNRCSSAAVQCAPFDNATRIPSTLWTSGPLPAVP